MNYVIARINNVARGRNFNFRSDFQQSIHSFADYYYVALHGPAQTNVGQIHIVTHRARLKK